MPDSSIFEDSLKKMNTSTKLDMNYYENELAQFWCKHMTIAYLKTREYNADLIKLLKRAKTQT